MIWPFNRQTTTETGAEYYIRDADVADAKALVSFKHRIWRDIFASLKDAEFFDTAEATSDDQVQFWQSRIRQGDTVWLAEDLRDTIVGTIHSGETQAEHTSQFTELYGLTQLPELRFFYLSDAAQEATVGQALIQQAVGDQPAITWLAGETPLVEASLVAAGFEPLGEAVRPTLEPWRGVPRQAMVRK